MLLARPLSFSRHIFAAAAAADISRFHATAADLPPLMTPIRHY